MGAGAGEVHSPPAGGAGTGVESLRNRDNYRITDADRLGEGSLKEKFEQNVAAIELLRVVESESRPATAAEKSVLVRYTGWGGLPQVFATPNEALKWRAEQARLIGLLRPDEYRAARATVLNAHYTSPTVIRAMYAGWAGSGSRMAGSSSPRAAWGTSLASCPRRCAPAPSSPALKSTP